MDWNIKTASGREKLRIRERKLSALYEMQPDLLPERPYSFFPYMAEDCVLRSDRLAKPLIGQAIRDFLIQEKRAGLGSGPMPVTGMVESMEDGDILMRIRPRFGDREPDGQLVHLELNAEGKVCLIDRFDENRLQYRAFRTSVSLTPVRVVREGEKCRYEKNDAEMITVPDLYYDEMRLLFYIVPVPECPVFEDMEERYMNKSDWAAILDLWKEVNAAKDYNALRTMVFETEEEYVRQNEDYGRELEELIRAVLQKREPYGRRMQAWMEDWLRGLGGEYDLIWKC